MGSGPPSPERSLWKVTSWPGRRLPHPEREVISRWSLHPEGAFVPLDPSLEARAAGSPPPGEFDETYLRLIAVDLDSDEEILQFVNSFDAIEIYVPDSGSRSIDVNVRAPYPALSAYPGFDFYEDYDESRRLEAMANAARAAAPGGWHGERWARPLPTIHEFRWAARCMRDLVTAYRCLSHQLPTTGFTWENPMLAADGKHQRDGEESFWTVDGAALQEFVAETLQIGLSGYTPRLVFREDLFPTQARDWREHFGAGADLWAICCLELFNHVVEAALHKACANESCGRLFVRQAGRAQHGQRRRFGVRYCSASCAKAQAQRDYQRRKRARPK